MYVCMGRSVQREYGWFKLDKSKRKQEKERCYGMVNDNSKKNVARNSMQFLSYFLTKTEIHS